MDSEVEIKMKCQNCGGEIIFKGNFGECCSCGSRFQLESAFENTEVYLCYVENDNHSRRTRDSVIAENIYKSLSAKKINTYYDRISASETIGNELEIARHSAMFHAKIVVFVGTSAENFSTLYHKYLPEIHSKRVIPAYSGIKPEQLPNEIKQFQATNIDLIGAQNDLSVSVLNLLGRHEEVKLDEIYKAKKKKSKAVIISLISVLAVLVIAVAIGLVFVMQKNKTPVLTDQEIYDNAITLMNDGSYLEAAAEFFKIPDFNDSTIQIKKIYDRYDGYYQTEDKSTALHINAVDGKMADISLEKTVNGQKVTMSCTGEITENVISTSFKDSFSNEGNASVTLANETISVKTEIINTVADASIGNTDLTFELSKRTDSPEIPTVTKAVIDKWLSKKTYYKDIIGQGFGLSCEYVTKFSARTTIDSLREYKVENSEVALLMACFDFANQNFVDGQPEISELKWDEEKAYVIAISAPAEVICSEQIGGNDFITLENNIIKVSNSTCSFEEKDLMFHEVPEQIGACIVFYHSHDTPEQIQKNSSISITSKLLIGETLASILLDEAIKDRYPFQQYSAQYTVTASQLNVRSAPGTDASSLGKLPQGTVVTANGYNAEINWFRIDYNGQEGYISGDYLELANENY